MAKITLTGTIQDIKDVQTKEYNGNVYYSRQIIITETADQYPQTYLLDFNGPTQCDYLERFKIGDTAEFSCFLNGRSYSDKNTGEPRVFMQLVCSYIQRIGEHYQNTPSPAAANTPQNAPDDLPF